MRILIVGHDCEEKNVIADSLCHSCIDVTIVFKIKDEIINEDTIKKLDSSRENLVEIPFNMICVAESWPVRVKCVEKFDKIITVEDVEVLKKEIPHLNKKED